VALSRRQRVLELLDQQAELKSDLTIAKNTLLVQPDSWSFDCTFPACVCRPIRSQFSSVLLEGSLVGVKL